MEKDGEVTTELRLDSEDIGGDGVAAFDESLVRLLCASDEALLEDSGTRGQGEQMRTCTTLVRVAELGHIWCALGRQVRAWREPN